MRAYHVLLTVLVTMAACDALSLGLPSLFGSLVSAPLKEGEVEEESNEPAETDEIDGVKDEEDEPLEYNNPNKPNKKPTKKPLFGFIPHPANHHLHPHNNPHHPLHPDNLQLPHLPLPHLPGLGHGHKEPIHATKTVYAELTERVTVHPVCMTVAHGVKPPCLPFVPEHYKPVHHHHGIHHHHHPGHHPGLHHHFAHGHHRDEEAKAGNEPLDIQPTAAVTLDDDSPTRILGGVTYSDGETIDGAEDAIQIDGYPDDLGAESVRSARHGEKPQEIQPTASVKLDDSPTRIMGGVTFSDGQTIDAAEGHSDDLGSESARGARYVEITPSISAPESVQIKEEPEEPEGTEEENQRTPLDMVNNLFNHKPVTHYKTKTIWVTKVDKVLDTRVTATLIAKNCIPTNYHIPWCSNHHLGVYGPGFHGHDSEHVYHNGPHGHYHPTVYTEKDEQQPSENNIQDDNAYDKRLNEEESRTEEPDYAEEAPELRESGSGVTSISE